jgi:hypothetical protein
MRQVFKPFFAIVLLFVAFPLCAQRSGAKDPTLNRGEGLEMTRSDLDKMRNQSQDKNSRQVDIFMFASSFSLLDSVLYVSEIQKLENVTVNNKWFVKERAAFEKQFTDYVRSGYIESQLTSIIFAEKNKKVERRRARLIKRNAKTNRFKLIEVSGFSFSDPTVSIRK